jgi:hypothetical protein
VQAHRQPLADAPRVEPRLRRALQHDLAELLIRHLAVPGQLPRQWRSRGELVALIVMAFLRVVVALGLTRKEKCG